MVDVIPACTGSTPLDTPEAPPSRDVQQDFQTTSTGSPGTGSGNGPLGMHDDQSFLLQLSGADAPPLAFLASLDLNKLV